MARKAAKVEQYWATGRRKKAIARVRLIPSSKANFTINKENMDDYFAGQDTLKIIAKQALVLVDAENKYDVFVNRNNFTAYSVKSFAKSIERNTGIVVGRLEKEKYISYGDPRFKGLKQQYTIDFIKWWMFNNKR